MERRRGWGRTQAGPLRPGVGSPAGASCVNILLSQGQFLLESPGENLSPSFLASRSLCGPHLSSSRPAPANPVSPGPSGSGSPGTVLLLQLQGVARTEVTFWPAETEPKPLSLAHAVPASYPCCQSTSQTAPENTAWPSCPDHCPCPLSHGPTQFVVYLTAPLSHSVVFTCSPSSWDSGQPLSTWPQLARLHDRLGTPPGSPSASLAPGTQPVRFAAHSGDLSGAAALLSLLLRGCKPPNLMAEGPRQLSHTVAVHLPVLLMSRSSPETCPHVCGCVTDVGVII